MRGLLERSRDRASGDQGQIEATQILRKPVETLDAGSGAALGFEIIVVWVFDEVDAWLGRHLRHDQGALVVPIDAVAVVGIVGVIG